MEFLILAEGFLIEEVGREEKKKGADLLCSTERKRRAGLDV